MKKYYNALILISISFALLSCDPGRSTLSNVKEKYSFLQGKELSSQSIEDTKTYASLLKVLAEAHKDKKSGKEAAQILEELKAKAQTRLTWITNEYKTRSEKIEPLLTAIILKGKEWKKKAVLASYNSQVKANSCVVTPEGSEFSKGPEYLEIKVYKILKLGKTEALSQLLFKADQSDISNSAQKLKELNESEPTGTIFYQAHSISCTVAEKFANDYKAFLKEVNTQLDPLMTESKNLTSIISSELF